MNRVRRLLAPLLFAQLLYSPFQARGDDATIFPLPDYSGGILERDHALGDAGGLRSKLAGRGVQLEVDFTQVYQAIVSGTGDGEDAYTGSLDYVLKIDIQKLGLWPGGFLLVRGETLFGGTINGKNGALIATNADALFPVPFQDKTTLTDLNFVQFLHPSFAIALGKLSTLDGDMNAFAHGRGTDQFMGLGNVLNPVVLRTIPYAALGAAAIWLPRKHTIVQFSALDSEGSADESGFDTVFEGGTSLALEMRNTSEIAGLPGHQLLGASWSNRNVTALTQEPRILLNLIPAVTVPAESKSDSWSVFGNFDQYLWKPDAETDRGIGIFARGGIADEETNPISWFFGVGVAAKGLIPCRPLDQTGVAYWISGTSDDLPHLLNLDKGQAVEIYYNAALTPWLFLTGDLQIVKSALHRQDTSVVLGTRLKIEF